MPDERARRQDRLQHLESRVEPVPFDGECARAYGRIYAAARASGHQPRRRAVDLLIAATALAHGMPLYTRNADDFAGLENLLTIVAVWRRRYMAMDEGLVRNKIPSCPLAVTTVRWTHHRLMMCGTAKYRGALAMR